MNENSEEEDIISYSQPIVYEEPHNSFRTMSPEPIRRRREGMSSTEANIKLAEFEDYIQNVVRITREEDGYTADEIDTEDDNGHKVSFFYFIGRLNPPHNGHIKALRTLVEMANNVNAVPLILLGSGPKGERTLDNPITFDVKKRFIQSVLPGTLGETYIIMEMKNPAQNIANYISEGLEKNGDQFNNITNIEITHIAGGKDEDTTKLSFALDAASKTARSVIPEAEVTTNVTAIEAEPTEGDIAMSATKVRKDTYRTLLDGTGYTGWSQKYKDFYGPMAEEIYGNIIEPTEKIDEHERMSVLQYYIEHGEMPKMSSKRKRKGGNKRTKNKRNKPKTRNKKNRRKISRHIHK
jgi:nicotinamide mononucleotide adenylyltransferase